MKHSDDGFSSVPPYYRLWQETYSALLAVLGPEPLTRYECSHGIALGTSCDEPGGCHLDIVRSALGRAL